MQNDGYYWHPFRPAFRWPMRGLAVLILVGVIFAGPKDGEIRWSSLLFGAAFLLWSFRAPQRRPQPFSSPIGRFISRLLIGAVILAALTSFVYFTFLAPQDRRADSCVFPGRKQAAGTGVPAAVVC